VSVHSHARVCVWVCEYVVVSPCAVALLQRLFALQSRVTSCHACELLRSHHLAGVRRPGLAPRSWPGACARSASLPPLRAARAAMTRWVAQPRRVEALEGVRVGSVAAGAFHSGAVDADGNAFTWGRGDSSQLGTGLRNHECSPQQVRGRKVAHARPRRRGTADWHARASARSRPNV
jgi:hypothetical protein